MNKMCSYTVNKILESTVNGYVHSQGPFTENMSDTAGSISNYSETSFPYKDVLNFFNNTQKIINNRDQINFNLCF